MKGICMLGALQYCIDNKRIDDIHTYIGTSIGAIIGYLLIIGYTPIEILIYICIDPIFKQTPILDFMSMWNGDGAISYTYFSDYLERMTIDKIGKVMTLHQLYDTYHKTLVVTTYNYTQSKLEYISWKTHPDIPCISALRMSSTLPLLNSMFKYMSNYYIDGGIVDNFPILYDLNVDSEEDISKRLGFVLQFTPEDTATKETEHEPFHVLHFLFRLLTIPRLEEMKNKKKKVKNMQIIELECSLPAFEPCPTSTHKMEAFSTGYQQAKEYFNSLS